MSAPLDLDQFEGFTPGPDYTGNGRLFRHANEVLAECKRLRASEASQREEIARLREALSDLFYAVEGKAIFTDSVAEAMGFETAREAARAALGEGQG